MAIEIMMTGYCKNCPVAELEAENISLFSDPNIWAIRCTHEAACERIFKGRFANDKGTKEKESNK